MKPVAMTLVGLGLTLLVAAEAGAQHSLAIDTCAPHRASFYGYALHGGHAPLRHGRRVGSVQPFQGMINPRYAPRYYVAVVEEPAPYYTTRVYNNMPREIRQRQEEIEIASDEELLMGAPPAPPRPADPADRYRDLSQRRPPRSQPSRPDAAAPRRERSSQAELLAARGRVNSGRVVSEVETMSAEAARSYADRASATMSRLREMTHRPEVQRVTVHP